MPPARQQIEASPRSLFVFRLGQNPPAASDDSIGGKDERARISGGDRPGLRRGKAQRMLRRKLRLQRRLVDIRSANDVWIDPDLPQQVESPGRGRSQDQPSYLNRNVIRPLVRS